VPLANVLEKTFGGLLDEIEDMLEAVRAAVVGVGHLPLRGGRRDPAGGLQGGAGQLRRDLDNPLALRNFNPGNAGPIFFFDVLVPLVHVALLKACDRPETRGRRRLLRRV